MSVPTPAQYEKATKDSFANQRDTLVIPYPVIEKEVGFQPLGLVAQGNTFVVAGYEGPSFAIVQVENDPKFANFSLKFSWTSEVYNENRDLLPCMFPDIHPTSHKNRMQTVNFGQNGQLWISRNAENVFYIIEGRIDGKWYLVDRVELPHDGRMVHSALLRDDQLTTIESTANLDELWSLNRYHVEYPNLVFVRKVIDLPPWFYGLVEHDENFLVLPNLRSDYGPGIYSVSSDGQMSPKVFDDRLWGNGICVLDSGVTVISQYGPAHPDPAGAANKLLFLM